VWEATKVRNLLDSLYQGYPVGYLIAWRNHTVKLKDGTTSAGKRILIDGQQRVTALWSDVDRTVVDELRAAHIGERERVLRGWAEVRHPDRKK